MHPNPHYYLYRPRATASAGCLGEFVSADRAAWAILARRQRDARRFSQRVGGRYAAAILCGRWS